MEHLERAYASWAELVEPLGSSMLAWAHPAMTPGVSATASWPLMRFAEASAIAAVYLAFVLLSLPFRRKEAKEAKETGKGIMAFVRGVQREPIKVLALGYNLAQVLLCVWMVYEAARIAVENNLPPVCGPFDFAQTRIAFVLWVFYLSKILDFFDTFFIVARGKWEQLSLLHVYHHFSIFLVYWVVTSVGYDGDVYFTIIANGTIHAIMYTYYFLTLFNYRPSWGKNLTQMQMLQFILMNAQAIYILVMRCAYPNQLTAFYLAYIISLFGLFMQFYLQRWAAPATKATKGSKLA